MDRLVQKKVCIRKRKIIKVRNVTMNMRGRGDVLGCTDPKGQKNGQM